MLQSEDEGKYISFDVTPVAATGIAIGTGVESAAGLNRNAIGGVKALTYVYKVLMRVNI